MPLEVGYVAMISSTGAPAIDQEPLLRFSAPKEPFAPTVSPKRSVGATNQNVDVVGS
jgi:hypothetical protein